MEIQIKRAVFDSETNGLLENVSKVHCICIEDYDSGVMYSFVPSGFPYAKASGTIEDGLKTLEDAQELIGHNILGYDIPALTKVYPRFKPKGILRDTLCYARVLWADIRETDFGRFRKGKLPAKMIGKHSLEAWGYRLGEYKGEFGKTANWDILTHEMITYCEQDVRVTSKLYHHILRKEAPQMALDMEQEIHRICLEQTAFGFPFDTEGARKLTGQLKVRQGELAEKIANTLGRYWVVGIKERVSSRTTKYKDVLRGNEFKDTKWTQVKVVEFNPSSRTHISKRLIDVFQWQPKEFGEDGNPTINDDVLEKLGETLPIAKDIAEYFMLDKRLGQIAEGDQAWLSHEVNGKIHGQVETMGAVTRRCAHKKPNLAQIPANHSPYGKECRSLFKVENGEYLLGCDVSGLELRMLAHYMAKWDGGAYGELILNGDVHTANQHAAGLPTRDNAKTFIYGFLYGAGDEKIAEIIKGTKAQGKALKEKFLKNTPALASLREAVKNTVINQGKLKSLDGIYIPVRHQHAALNTLLQSAGAIVCKMWVCRFHELMREHGFIHGVHYKQAAFVHDELQIRCVEKFFPREYYTDAKGKVHTRCLVGELCVQAIADVGKKLNVRIPLTGEYSTGASYAETH